MTKVIIPKSRLNETLPTSGAAIFLKKIINHQASPLKKLDRILKCCPSQNAGSGDISQNIGNLDFHTNDNLLGSEHQSRAMIQNYLNPYIIIVPLQ
jgi:hypothetical protein